MAGYDVRRVLAVQDKLGECPLWDEVEQRLYWIDIDGQLLRRFDPATGKAESWTLPEVAGAFVLKPGGGGVVLAMGDGFHDFDLATGRATRLAEAAFDTTRFRFNDGRTDRAGRFWVGTIAIDMATSAQNPGAFYSYNGQATVERINPIEVANGTAFTPDGRTMFRAESTRREILAYDIAADGAVSNERVFAVVPEALGMPDGATIDSEGGYWVALVFGAETGHVARFAPDGRLDIVIPMPVLVPTMVAFGGLDLSTLYVTSAQLEHFLGREASPQAGDLFAVEVPYKGVPETRFRAG